MNEPPLEQWVRDALEERARTVDAAKILDGVHTRLAASSARVATRGLRRRRWLWRAALAAAVFLAAFWGLQLRPQPASAEMIVRQALQKAQEEPLDRCYQVVHELKPGQMEGSMLLPLQGETRLWTRGGRFWIEPVRRPGTWAWGRDEQGRVWVAPAPQLGFRFAADEVPPALAQFCDLFHLQMDTLLQDALAHCDLHREEPASATEIIRAELKPGHQARTLRSAVLEIDTQSKAVRRLVLVRNFQRATAQVAFTLVETRPQAEVRYRLEDHLQQGARVHTVRQEALRLLEKLRRTVKTPRP
ncbi:MAG TPA: hypothetical protein VEL76_34925 [Gemmataceae bacterium]|nr:hypothetical protein [Gemmataceae bacterium]